MTHKVIIVNVPNVGQGANVKKLAVPELDAALEDDFLVKEVHQITNSINGLGLTTITFVLSKRED